MKQRLNNQFMRIAFSVFLLATLICHAAVSNAAGAAGAESQEDVAYQDAIALFNQMQWTPAFKALESFERNYPKSRWRHSVILRLGDLEPEPAKALKRYQMVLDSNSGEEWNADARWGMAQTRFVLGQYQQAAELFDHVTSNEGMRHAQALYMSGLAFLALKNYTLASQRFNKVMELYQGSPWSGLALAGIGESELNAGNLTASVNAFNRYLRDFPDGDLADRVLMLKSKAMASQGMPEESTRLLHELVTKYTESFEAEKSKSSLVESQHKFTIQVGAFSKKEYAAQLVQRLRKKGYNAYILQARHGDEIYNQVRIGSYTTREFSEKMAKKIEESEQLPILILPYVKPELIE